MIFGKSNENILAGGDTMPSTLVSDDDIACSGSGMRTLEFPAAYSNSAIAESTCCSDCFEEDEMVNEALEQLKTRYAYRFIKRLFGIVFSLFILIAFSWLLLIIAIAIKIDDPKGPVLFKQKRATKGGREFWIYKFRSMCVDTESRLEELKSLNEKTGPVFKMSNDPRVTRVGYWLRKLSLDELPQFVNVLKSEIPWRILKTRQGFSLKKPGAFALPAKLARTRIAASLQVMAVICAIAGVPQNLFEYFIAGYGEMREVFVKRGSRIDFPLIGRFKPVPCNGFPI